MLTLYVAGPEVDPPFLYGLIKDFSFVVADIFHTTTATAMGWIFGFWIPLALMWFCALAVLNLYYKKRWLKWFTWGSILLFGAVVAFFLFATLLVGVMVARNPQFLQS